MFNYTRRGIFVLLLFGVAGCVGVPKDQIVAFASSYASVDAAGRAVYVQYEIVTRGKLGARPSTITPSRFSALYYDVVGDSFSERAPTQTSDDLAARFAAMDAMLVFNQGLVAIVEGRGIEEIKAIIAPLQIVATAAGGPAGAAFTPIAEFVAKGVEAAKSRADLVKAMTAEIEPITIGQGEDAQTYSGHPANALLQALEDDARDMNKVILGRLADRIEELQSRWGESPTDDTGKLEYAAAYEDAEKFLETVRSYRQLLGTSRQYFVQLREAAVGQTSIAQTAEFVSVVIEMGAEARALLKTL